MVPELQPDVERLARDLAEIGTAPLLVVTGAGISLASGIPTFRGQDPGAIWQSDLVERATHEFFQRDPAASWSWYLARFAGLAEARPNAGHEALVALEAWQTARGGEFLLVTQNIDTLHEDAGSRRLVKVHGSADRVRCSRGGCGLGAPTGSLPRDPALFAAFAKEPLREHVPGCPDCGAPLRPHVLWFDELYQGHDDYGFDRVLSAASEAALFLFVGTSFSVGVTDLLVRSALGRRAPAYAVDPGGCGIPGLCSLRHPAEMLLPALCHELGRLVAAPGPLPLEGRRSI